MTPTGVPAGTDHPLEVRPVTSKRDLKRFITLPRQIYAGLEGFVAPFDIEQSSLLHPKRAAIFQHADIQYFLAWRGGKAVGRIAAIMDSVAIQHWQGPIGQFGALDCLPEQAVVDSLLNAAEKWLRARGATTMRGPYTLSCNGETGIMVEGQLAPPTLAMPWHPKGLGDCLERAGFTKTKDLLSYRLDLTPDLQERFKTPGQIKMGEGRFRDITTRPMVKKEIVTQAETLRQLYNDAWSQKDNFIPLQSHEMAALMKQISPLLKPEHYVQIDRKGEPLAMALVLPNLHDITGDLNGDPSPLGWVKFGYRMMRHRFTSARVTLLGVSHKVRGTMLGALLPSLAIMELIKRADRMPYKWVELGWIQEDDSGMRNLAESLVPKAHKCHRVYEKPLD
ncbi:hypothetical protein [Formicincola oecophyllae]|uniref:hypothetical protein n=1 Tax=Formicincola oecophyllae TaxID=2558361 RepID=UPI001F0F834E|nr:hypothetical protein [Formicincola oecophyllae]